MDLYSGKSQTDSKIQDLIRKRDFTLADEMIGKKIEEAPGGADGYYLKGVSSYFQNKIVTSIENLRLALNYDPKHTDSAICLSVLLNDIGKYDEAKRVFDQANQSVAHRRTGDASGIDRKFSVKHLELADLYFRYRRYDEAIEEYGKALLLDPGVLDIRIRRAKAYAKKGFLTRAVQELQHLIREHTDFLPARIQLGLLHYSQGNVLDAELEWEAVLEQEHSHREALAYLEMAKEGRVRL